MYCTYEANFWHISHWNLFLFLLGWRIGSFWKTYPLPTDRVGLFWANPTVNTTDPFPISLPRTKNWICPHSLIHEIHCTASIYTAAALFCSIWQRIFTALNVLQYCTVSWFHSIVLKDHCVIQPIIFVFYPVQFSSLFNHWSLFIVMSVSFSYSIVLNALRSI